MLSKQASSRFPKIQQPFGDSESGSEKTRLFYWLSGLYILINGILIFNELYWFTAVPLILFGLALAFLRTEIVFFVIVIFTPLSVNFNDIGMGFGLSLPVEPMIMLLLMVFVLKLLLQGSYDRKILTHPVSMVILLHLIWMTITSITSTLPIVSFKYLISRTWFVIVFYFFALHVFSKAENREKFIWYYMIPLGIVILYTIYRHYQFGFTEKSAHWVMDPFYNDHTAYAAAIAMFLPFLIFEIISPRDINFTRWFAFALLLLFVLALVLSFTRAAWLSIAASLAVFVIFILKIKFRTLLLAGISIIALFIVFQQEIFQKLERNRQDSSKDFSRHLQSISNIRTDASNLERINRWHSAIRMFAEKPIFGFGPGTYQFNYAPFQHSSEKTIISTNTGTKGTAHSEYLGPLAEQGFAGLLFFSLIVIFVIYRATMIWSQNKSDVHHIQTRWLSLILLLGLVTYFVHGLLNNFLDTDKASVIFWGFIAIIVAMDIETKKSKLTNDKILNENE